MFCLGGADSILNNDEVGLSEHLSRSFCGHTYFQPSLLQSFSEKKEKKEQQ